VIERYISKSGGNIDINTCRTNQTPGSNLIPPHKTAIKARPAAGYIAVAYPDKKPSLSPAKPRIKYNIAIDTLTAIFSSTLFSCIVSP